MLARRDAMPTAERNAASAEIVARMGDLVAAWRPTVLAGYWPIRSEADIRAVLAAATDAGVAVALPALAGEVMVFRRWRPGDGLSRTALRFLEPAADQDLLLPDLILLPLAGFDRTGNRLGYGRGYYDRAISGIAPATPPVLVGVAFAGQELATISSEPHDVPLDAVVTEEEAIAFSAAGRAFAAPAVRGG